MPKSYSSSVRRPVCARLRDGEPVAEIASETGISEATSFRWKAQALVDAGIRDGVPSVEADELAAACKRISELEAELAVLACSLVCSGIGRLSFGDHRDRCVAEYGNRAYR
ncbi:transposase [Nocardia sp. NPDC004604]|uniref:transposase n=1 Tax=Nocardia sp. NPDC004604 TaxID=3157013 RepID=UPI0033B56912